MTRKKYIMAGGLILTIFLGGYLIVSSPVFWNSYFSQELETEIRYPLGWTVEEPVETTESFLSNLIFTSGSTGDWAITVGIKKGSVCSDDCDPIEVVDREMEAILDYFEKDAAVIEASITTPPQQIEHKYCHVATKDFLLPAQNAAFISFPNRVFGLVCGGDIYVVRVLSKQEDFRRAADVTARMIATIGVDNAQ